MLLLVLLLGAFAAGWSVSIFSYGGGFSLYNGSLLIGESRDQAIFTVVVPGGWPLEIRWGNLSIPLNVSRDVFVALGGPGSGCDVFLFYSIAMDSTSAVVICAERTEAVLSAGGLRRAVSLDAGVWYFTYPGRVRIAVESSSKPVRLRGDVITVAYPPVVYSGLLLRSGPPDVYIQNCSYLGGRIYNLSAALAAQREFYERRVADLSARVKALSQELEAVRAERDRLLVVGPQSVALYASVAAGVAGGVFAVYLARRRQKPFWREDVGRR